MGELISSEAELNAAGSELDDLDSADDHSLESIDSDTERRIKLDRKKNGVKINNSFTGPYPIDPTDFDHNDKGPNPQFILGDL